MNCEIFTFNPLEVNCCILWDEDSRDAAIVDCSARKPEEFSKISSCIRTQKLNLRYALQTHMHFDHVFGLPRLYEEFGIGPSCHALEQEIYDYAPLMASSIRLPIMGQLPPITNFLADGEKLKVGKIAIEVIHTPGHTPGGLCFYLPETDQLFSGDTLFCESIGRTDLPGGDSASLTRSIRDRLFTLPEETRVLPGHGNVTNIGWERENNPFV